MGRLLIQLIRTGSRFCKSPKFWLVRKRGRLFRIFVVLTLAVVLLVCALQVQLDYPRPVQAAQGKATETSTAGQWDALKPTKALKLIHIPGTDSSKIDAWGEAKGYWSYEKTGAVAAADSQEFDSHNNSELQPFARLSAEVRNRYDWFMVVRHPVERIVSQCASLLSKRLSQVSEANINQFLQSILNGTQLLDAEAESIRPMMDQVDTSVVQHIVRYERLNEDLPKLLQFYNLSLEALPEVQKLETHPKLWPATLQMIYQKFSEDFVHFNYSMADPQDASLTSTEPPESLTSTVLATTATTVATETTQAATFFGMSLPSLPWRTQKELKFIHITKTGGSAIENWAKSHGLLWGRFHVEYRAPGRKGSPWHHPFPELPSELRHRYDWFMVVRNPVERVVSEYYCPWTGTKTPETDNEDAFNKFVQSSLDGSRWLHWGSFQAMSDYLDATSVQHVLHFESLAKDLARLLPQYGISFDSLPRTNVAQNRKFNAGNLWPQTSKLIRANYSADFENFNYTCRRCPD